MIIPNKSNTLDVGNNVEFKEIVDGCMTTSISVIGKDIKLKSKNKFNILIIF